MHNISLPKMQILVEKITTLLVRRNVDDEFLLKLVEDIKKVKCVVMANGAEFSTDADKILALCEYLIFNLRLEINRIHTGQDTNPLRQ
ncbi:MAG: hypothetical protein NDI69_09160 [Bacteriovoracaceae bacterium]|nr:hypothetical protein [Bacteriovoracaceae bacterium]